MRLIGMLDSPYVRRVAISLKLLRLPFGHEPVSVFRHFDAFAAINPVVKAPTLVTDSGVVLMESTLILQHAERLADPALTLEPADLATHARAQRLIGLALAACEKTVQIVYEHELRPQEKRHEPWLARVRGQLRAAYRLLEAEIGPGEGWLLGQRPMQADVTAAVTLGFTHLLLPGEIADADVPRLAALAARAEALPEFAGTPMT
ncbi:glutathione S-transferase family protein [Ancylobacter sp. Lp-2]|uniref:glutathione S-transferase family protein n=1 Tax=Ancylobacter sp. Lp-2 TaxID=2881339 RepID=UPI001E2C4494|nr:glutathione S-transferase family protein [Ancylobacter sp. Lp-2]MCB4770338.1 glutathione S-transferase family protein [Ancylobacter sp. Lp-2]